MPPHVNTSAHSGDQSNLARHSQLRSPRLLALTVTALLVAMGFGVSARPAAAAQPDTVDVAAIEQFLTKALDSTAIPGAAVALTQGDRVLLARGFGHDSTGAPVTADTSFRIASLSKSFTSLAVMQLVDAGQLDLDDPVLEHLPEFQLADPRAEQITVRHLLDHTSGLTDAQVPALSRPQPATPAEATSDLASARLASTPGTSYSYHNPNYHVAARLVEVISGEPFNTYLRDHIIRPAGMTSTIATTTDDQPVPGLPHGHVTAYGHAFPAPGIGTFAVGDGGVVSTATDMARWLALHAGDGRAAGARVISRRGLETLHTASAPGSGYALGWDTVGPADAPTRLEHSGNLFTFSGYQAIWPTSGYGVVLLFNSSSGLLLDQTAIAHGVFDIVEGNQPPAPGMPLTYKLDALLALLTLIALVLGAHGVLTSSRWAGRHYPSPRRVVLRLLPALSVVVLAAALPWLVEAGLGRDVTWRVIAYGWPALVILAIAAAGAATSTLFARTWHLHRRSGASATRSPARNLRQVQPLRPRAPLEPRAPASLRSAGTDAQQGPSRL